MGATRRASVQRKSGGRIGMKVSGNPDVFKEAEGKKHGGHVKSKDVGHMAGGKSKHRMDRPGRKSGGRVGANKAPLSTAHNVTTPARDGETERGAPD